MLTLLLLATPLSLPADGESADVPGVGRVTAVGAGVYSGPLPEDWEAVRSLGFAAVVCVDTLAPDAEGVTHVPCSYSGLSPGLATLRLPEGTVYVHCHHGKYRGPAAAVFLARRRGLPDAVAWERLAGTVGKYAGLKRDAMASVEAIASRESDDGGVLRRSMAELDRAFDAEGVTPEQATVIEQAFREAARDPSASESLVAELRESERLAGRLVRGESVTAELAERCDRCHNRHR